MLKTVRVFLSTLVCTALVAFFLDFAQVLPDWFAELTTLQAVPALLAANGVVLVALTGLTLVGGRVYCSILCPLGVLQDVLGRLSGLFARKKRRFRFAPARTGIRWSMVAVATLGPLTGMTVLLSLVEPYSIFGRAANHVFRPVVIAVNNVLEQILPQFNIYELYHVANSPFSLAALAVAVLGLLVVGLFACTHGRLYCNTLCPVGTVLGLLGSRPLFGIRIDAEQCSRCGKCEARCKGFCIDSQNCVVDFSRCVACMNCLDQCSKGALQFSFRLPFRSTDTEKKRDVPPASDSRRKFLIGSLATLPALLPGASFAANAEEKPVGKTHPILPPGANSLAHFTARCTACHACMGKCPSRVLKPALLDYGPGGFLQPLMDYSEGFCSYDCTICTQMCPNGALTPLSLEEKHHAQIGRVVFVEELCVVRTQGTHCGACAEHCPTQAVTMVPHVNGVTIPSINPDICVGCGGCEFICPVRPFRAIFVEGLAVQGRRHAIQEEKLEKNPIDSFGF